MLWWSWTGYAWLGNVVRADEGVVREVMLAAMATMFIFALAIPEAFDDLPGGLYGPVVVPICYLVFRLLAPGDVLDRLAPGPGLAQPGPPVRAVGAGGND